MLLASFSLLFPARCALGLIRRRRSGICGLLEWLKANDALVLGLAFEEGEDLAEQVTDHDPELVGHDLLIVLRALLQTELIR